MSRGELIDELCRRDKNNPEPSHLLHQLQVHQVELETQNQQLAQTQTDIEHARARYADLFDHAPVAYCVFDRGGVIREVNATAATLLRASRSGLVGVPFTRVVEIAEPQTFLDHLGRCLGEELRVSTDVTMRVRGRGEIVVQMVSTPVIQKASRVETCRTMLNDVTRIKRSEGLFRFLADVNEALVSTPLDLESRLSAVVGVCLPTLGDACFIDLCAPDSDSSSLVKRVRVAPPNIAAQLDRAAEDPGWCKYRTQLLTTLTPVFEPTSASALGAYQAHIDACGLLLLPLAMRGKTLGLLGLMMTQSKRTYSLQDFELAQDFARRAAAALDNALLYEMALAKGQRPAVAANPPTRPPVAPPSRPHPVVLLVDTEDQSRDALHRELVVHGWDVVDLPTARDAVAYVRAPNVTPAAIVVDAESVRTNADASELSDTAIPLVVFGAEASTARVARQVSAVGHFARPVAIDRLLAVLDD